MIRGAVFTLGLLVAGVGFGCIGGFVGAALEDPAPSGAWPPGLVASVLAFLIGCVAAVGAAL